MLQIYLFPSVYTCIIISKRVKIQSNLPASFSLKTYFLQQNFHQHHGRYLHSRFCETRSHICAISPTRSELKSQYVRALCQELRLRKRLSERRAVGAASTLEAALPHNWPKGLQADIRNHRIRLRTGIHPRDNARSNPDDGGKSMRPCCTAFPFNRISIGIQTFDDATLKLLESLARCPAKP